MAGTDGALKLRRIKMIPLTEAQKYIFEKWPAVNKAAIKYDKEQFHKAEEKKKTRKRLKKPKIIPASQIPRGYIW